MEPCPQGDPQGCPPLEAVATAVAAVVVAVMVVAAVAVVVVAVAAVPAVVQLLQQGSQKQQKISAAEGLHLEEKDHGSCSCVESEDGQDRGYAAVLHAVQARQHCLCVKSEDGQNREDAKNPCAGEEVFRSGWC